MAVIPGPYVGGTQAKLYYNSATHATPTWAEVTRAIDVSANIGQTAVDVSSRASKYKANLPGLIDVSFNFGYRVPGGTDTVLDLLLTMMAGATQTIKEFAIIDQAIATSGAQGPRLYAMIESADLSQALEEGAVIEFTLKPAYFEVSAAKVDPDWYEVP